MYSNGLFNKVAAEVEMTGDLPTTTQEQKMMNTRQDDEAEARYRQYTTTLFNHNDKNNTLLIDRII